MTTTPPEGLQGLKITSWTEIENYGDKFTEGYNLAIDACIAHIRAAERAATQPFPLSPERIDWLANCACAGGVAYPHNVKCAINDALREAGFGAATQPAGEVLGYAMFRDGAQQGVERTKEQAARWQGASAVPLGRLAAPISAAPASVLSLDWLSGHEIVQLGLRLEEKHAGTPVALGIARLMTVLAEAILEKSRTAAPISEASAAGAVAFDFHAHLAHQAAWSEKTFGPGAHTAGVCDHIRKELKEIEADPLDLKEWVDVIILALDGAWRCGGKPDEIIAGIIAKQAKNEGRNWPDWRTADPNKAIEHDRSGEGCTHQDAKAEQADSSSAAPSEEPPKRGNCTDECDYSQKTVEYHARKTRAEMPQWVPAHKLEPEAKRESSDEPHWLDSPQSALGGKTAREGYLANHAYAHLFVAPCAWKVLADKAVAVLNRHIAPDGISDKDALTELYGIFDGPEYRAALATPRQTEDGGADDVKDAARYRWLRDYGDIGDSADRPCVLFGGHWYGGRSKVGLDLDVALDAIIQKASIAATPAPTGESK
jgi:hypothetical protein